MIYLINQAEADQARKVNDAYSKTGSVNPEYEREFDILSDMRRVSMAAKFRQSCGLPPNGKTPYDSTPNQKSA